ncbi:MAG: isoleucine--tRNA ligase [Bacteroidota bacterium]
MSSEQKYREYKALSLSEISQEILNFWKEDSTFQKSIESRDADRPFVFYEGPPSANGKPGIHHVMARAIKDIVCRYKTLKGFRVERKAGWDTHGLPIELGVEKELGITKEDIGKTISVEDYNKACREAVMRYTDLWNEVTEKMGYWVDMDDPYITYENKYIESVWHLLQRLFNKDLIYKGYTIQPYSPKAGTGLSSHELNQPGCYRDVKDTSAVALFSIRNPESSKISSLISGAHGPVNMIAWTTTPWTLPSNTALAVGTRIDYAIVNTVNPYTAVKQTVILAKDLLRKYFKEEGNEQSFDAFEPGNKVLPWTEIGICKGEDLIGMKYDQLLNYTLPYKDADQAFQVIAGDFVSTEDGTGIVHIAPTFGADDARVAKDAGVPAMLVLDENDNPVPLVDLQGKFTSHMKELAGKYVKNEYYSENEAPDKSVDVEISVKLKTENKAFKVEKYVHSYPHCWRTDKPVLYYPLDSWFIQTTKVKDRLIALNNTINWKPKSTGEGRFGNWLENLNDWNLSRSRFWGIPIPIWRTEDGKEAICIGSAEELKSEIEKSIAKGFMSSNPLSDFDPSDMSDDNYNTFDLHKNYVDELVLVSESGEKMFREKDLIDVWFDSGSMPYAQLHYPFENKEKVESGSHFPADFIAEGVDQTRGWFFTLHAIATMCFDSVAYKNVMSNGLVLDKNGQKMSKRLGNAVNPFETLENHGPDATRWYMITNAQPWDNLKFDVEGITEVKRKFFGTLYNTYSFFALYANVDGFNFTEEHIPVDERPEIDRWIISKLNSLIKEVDAFYADFEPTKAGRAIQEFVGDHLSNWFVRLSRRRFWKGSYERDKISAYQTLHQCLMDVAIMSSPIAPFYSEKLYRDLNRVSNKNASESVHTAYFPEPDEASIDLDLEERMDIAQKVSSLVLSLRKKEKLKVRQPLQRVMIPIMDDTFEHRLKAVEELILSEVNVKELEYLKDAEGKLVKKIKPNFKTLGPKYGAYMKAIAAQVNQFDQEMIGQIERNGGMQMHIEGKDLNLELNDFEISSEDIPGWTVASEGLITVALDINLNESLKNEGLAREMVNRIQNLRKDKGLDVTDRINVTVQNHPKLSMALHDNLNYICAEILADRLDFKEKAEINDGVELDIETGLNVEVSIEKAVN